MNILKEKLTKWQINGIGGTYIRTQTITFPDAKDREIMVFSGEKALYLGQCTITGTIVIHESVIANKPLFDYVLCHEFAHAKQWWVVFIIPLIPLLLIGPLLFLFSLVYLFLAAIELRLLGVLSSAVGIAISFVMFAIPCGFSWIMELNAEFTAINKVGIQSFVDLKNAPRILRHNFKSNIIIIMTHPPAKVTVKLWQWYHKGPELNGS